MPKDYLPDTETRLAGCSSLERLIPDEIQPGESTGEETMHLHLARYHWAAAQIGSHTQIHTVLDAACGVGYGSATLAESNPRLVVTGADIDAAAIQYAKKRYGKSSVNYMHTDILKIREEYKFDAIVSLETIEHVPDPRAVIDFFHGRLNGQGLLILSVPITPSTDINPYHLTDFSSVSIRRLVRDAGFTIIDELLQKQVYSPIKILRKKESRVEDMRSNLLDFYIKNPVSLVKRVSATLRFGFSNRYLTLACQKSS